MTQEKYTLYGMDCRDAMGLFIESESVDSIVTDPPYGLGFMGKEWDRGVPGVEFWKAAYDCLKPGGHLLAFSGSRTYHRMVCAIEDAGFEIRDQIMWVYGSGFPKSLDVSKAIDKAAGAERELVPRIRLGSNAVSVTTKKGWKNSSDNDLKSSPTGITPAAQKWQGWGTALKPAHEPICVARKPFPKGHTVAANVMEWGTGALNIDGCRAATDENLNGGAYSQERQDSSSPWAATGSLHKSTGESFVQPVGRWPANLIHDGSDEVLAAFPDAKGQQGDLKETGRARPSSGRFGDMAPPVAHAARVEAETSAARFFYCAKTSKSDRGAGNTHPTVKPTDLMRYLVRLVTPPGGTTLDIFAGSGSTGKAAILEGFKFIGCENDPESVVIARARLDAAVRAAA